MNRITAKIGERAKRECEKWYGGEDAYPIPENFEAVGGVYYNGYPAGVLVCNKKTKLYGQYTAGVYKNVDPRIISIHE